MTREEAIKELKYIQSRMVEYAEGQTAMNMAIEALKERLTGKWVWSDEDASWKCGRCDCVFEEIDWKPNYNFCPNCGADMIGGDSE